MSPADRAAAALRDGRVMCDLLAAALWHGAPHVWKGSAYDNHPCGLIVGTVKVTNHWRVQNDCDIQITDGVGWDRLGISRDPRAMGGNPHPQPISGQSFTAWSNGRWESQAYQRALQGRVLEILTAAADHVERVEAKQRVQRAAEQATEAERRQAAQQRALAMVSGSPA